MIILIKPLQNILNRYKVIKDSDALLHTTENIYIETKKGKKIGYRLISVEYNNAPIKRK